MFRAVIIPSSRRFFKIVAVAHRLSARLQAQALRDDLENLIVHERDDQRRHEDEHDEEDKKWSVRDAGELREARDENGHAPHGRYDDQHLLEVVPDRREIAQRSGQGDVAVDAEADQRRYRRDDVHPADESGHHHERLGNAVSRLVGNVLRGAHGHEDGADQQIGDREGNDEVVRGVLKGAVS